MNSLYEKSIVAFCKHIDVVIDLETLDSIEILSHLPVSIQRDTRKVMKTIWFRNTHPPENPYSFEFRYLDIYCLDRKEFLMLINHPVELTVDFLPHEMQTCHVVFDYFKLQIGFEETYILCEACFKISCSPAQNYDDYEFEYSQFWSERNWKFFHVTKHFEISVDNVIEHFVKQESSWCDRCVFKPLFHFMDYSACKESTSTHDFESSSDSDVTVVTSHNTFELYDPYHF